MAANYGGPWTREKLRILEDYLDHYSTALKNQPFRLIYVDAFAGSGFWRPPSMLDPTEPDDFRGMWKGSAALALEIEDKQFDRLLFIEQDEERCDSLRRLAAHHTGREIQIVNDDSNRALPSFCRSLAPDERAVVFLDPFATQVSWHTVVALAETKRVDCWILFPLSAVVRMMPGQRDPDPEWAAHLDRVFGGRLYWQELYGAPTQLPLFGEAETERAGGSTDVLGLYRKRLESVFQKVAPTTKELRNSKNSPMFALFFAASNPRGADIAVRIADHILKGW